MISHQLLSAIRNLNKTFPSLLIGLLIMVVCCLKGKCSKLLALAPTRQQHHLSGGQPSSAHLPLAVLPPTILPPHQLIPPERHLEQQPQLQRHCNSQAFLQDSWQHRYEAGAQGGRETGRQHPSLVTDRLQRSPFTQGCSDLEAQPGVLAPKSWYEPRAPALELDANYHQPAFSPPPTSPHPTLLPAPLVLVHILRNGGPDIRRLLGQFQ